ncbi:MAG: phosphoribosyltransferase family protein [Thermoanaerobaculia bacterium]
MPTVPLHTERRAGPSPGHPPGHPAGPPLGALLRRWLDRLLPRYCLACLAPVPDEPGGGEALGLCRPCRGRLRRVDRRPVCRGCARPLGAESRGSSADRDALCGPCILDPPPQTSLFALWEYAPPVRELVHGLKFRRLDYLGTAAGVELGRALAAAGYAGEPFAAIVPVPLAWPRRVARGYNQCEEIAAGVARELALPVRRWLGRGLLLPHQTGRRRSARLRTGGFRVRRRAPVAGKRLLLLDDVYTTGATVRAASRALLAAGAARVDAAVVAWTAPAGSAPEPRREPPESPFYI